MQIHPTLTKKKCTNQNVCKDKTCHEKDKNLDKRLKVSWNQQFLPRPPIHPRKCILCTRFGWSLSHSDFPQAKCDRHVDLVKMDIPGGPWKTPATVIPVQNHLAINCTFYRTPLPFMTWNNHAHGCVVHHSSTEYPVNNYIVKS